MNTEFYRIFFEVQKIHWWFVTKKKIILDIIDRYSINNRPKNILDIGCGSGLMLNSLNNLGQTFGMDMSDEAVSFSKEIFNGRVEKGSLPDHIPYEENFFDLIIALDVIEHIDRDVDSLITIRSHLILGGKAIITVPAYMFLWSAFDEMNQHKRRYSRSELLEKLKDAGFTVEKISYYNTLLFPAIFAVRMLNNILLRNGASDLDVPNRPINYLLKKIFVLEKYLLRFGDFPFGVSILAVVRK